MAKRGRKTDAERAILAAEKMNGPAELTKQEVIDICTAIQMISVNQSGRDFATIRKIQESRGGKA